MPWPIRANEDIVSSMMYSPNPITTKPKRKVGMKGTEIGHSSKNGTRIKTVTGRMKETRCLIIIKPFWCNLWNKKVLLQTNVTSIL